MTRSGRSIQIIGVPIDLGAGRRGVDMGPSAIRIADLEPQLEELGHEVDDHGDLGVVIPETQTVGEDCLRFMTPILDTCRELMSVVRTALEAGRMPLVLGGDHSLTIGSLAGSSSFFQARGEGLGLIWFDAHGDFNTPETTPSGNIHGMSLAVALGLGDPRLTGLGGPAPRVQPHNAVLIGARDLDPAERSLVRESGMTVYTMRDLDERGMKDVVDEAVRIASDGTCGIHVSFDMDVIDPEHAPGTGTPVWGGISYREAHLAMELLADRADVVAVDLVEVNPVLDERNTTAFLAVELLLSLLGKRIL